jgi:hypothetical protein
MRDDIGAAIDKLDRDSWRRLDKARTLKSYVDALHEAVRADEAVVLLRVADRHVWSFESLAGHTVPPTQWGRGLIAISTSRILYADPRSGGSVFHYPDIDSVDAARAGWPKNYSILGLVVRGREQCFGFCFQPAAAFELAREISRIRFAIS